jgi:DNA-binding NarL/FixJ family response regulator
MDGIQILLLGDDPSFVREARMWTSAPNAPGVEFVWCRGLREGLARLACAGADLVVAELNLPDCRGLPTVTRLLHYAPGVPLIVLSQPQEGDLALEAVRAGAHGFLRKTQANDPEIFFRVVQRVLTRTQVERW